MGKRRYKLGLKIAAEQADIQAAAKKRGLWSSIGSTLGAALAVAVTGGAAAPAVAGMIAAGGSYAGGHLANYAAGTIGGAKLRGKGRFFSGERESLAKGIKDKIGATALKTGLQVTGMKVAGKLGGKIKLGKGPASVEIPMEAAKAGEVAKTAGGVAKTAGVTTTAAKESLWDTIFKSSDPKALAGQKGFGKLIDFQGSALGKKLSAAKSAKLATEFAEKGWIDPNLQTATSKFTDVFPDSGGKPIVAMDRFEGMAKQRVADIAEAQQAARLTAAKQVPQMADMSIRGQNQWDIIKSSDPVLSDIKKVGPSKFAGASEAQAEAVMAGEVPEWYGAPKGTTWGETAIDPGRSDISYAGSYAGSPDQVPYTGDVPDLMDLYKDETYDPTQAWRMQEAKSIDPISRMQRVKGAEIQDYGALEGIEKVSGPTDTYRSQEGLYSTSIPVSDKALDLSPIEQRYYDRVNQMTDQGYSVGAEGGLPEEYGRGYISKETGDIVRPPARPDVSLPAYKEDLEFVTPTTMDEVSVTARGPQLTEFGDWEEPIPRPLPKEFQAIDPLQGMQRQLDQSIMDKIVVPGRRRPTFPTGAGGPNDFIDFEDVPRKPWQKRIFG